MYICIIIWALTKSLKTLLTSRIFSFLTEDFRFNFEEIKFLWVHCFSEASKMTPASGLRSCTLHICNIWQSLFNSGTQGRNFMIRCSFIKRKNCQQGIEKRILRGASSSERRNTRDGQHFLCVKTSCFGRPGHDVTTSQVTSIALPFLSGSQSRRWNATQHLPMTIWEHPLGEHVQKKICENWNLHIPTQPSDIKASIENQINFHSNLPDLY